MRGSKKYLAMALLLIAALALTACSGGNEPAAEAGEPAQETFEMNLGMDSPEDTVTYLYAEKFSQLLSEKTGGAVEVQLYANGQLGNDRELVESLQTGSVDFVVQTTAPQVNFIPELAVFDMANVFPNVDVAREVLDGPFFDTVAKYYDDAGLKLLGYADQGFRTLTANREVHTLADLSGLKVRTMENPYHLTYWKAMGANPTPMAWGEVYIGLQQGMIDGQENPYEVIVANKMYEQQEYVINTNHILHTLSLAMSSVSYDLLPEEYQTAVYEAASEAKVWAREQTDLRIDERAEIILENGTEIIDLAPEVLAEMQEKAEEQYQEIRDAIGAELVDTLLDASKAAQ